MTTIEQAASQVGMVRRVFDDAEDERAPLGDTAFAAAAEAGVASMHPDWGQPSCADD